MVVAVSQGTCESNEVYAKIIKRTTTYASEESFTILSGTTTLYSSPTLVNDDLREIETCLTVSQNYQYTLAMHDDYGDSWADGGYIEIHSINDNLVLKTFMSEDRDETIEFSLYSPINK